jgi:putative heme-binding domain-containing protein
VKIGGAPAAGGGDVWIRDAFRTAKAHLNNEAVEDTAAVKAPAHLKGAVREQYLKGAEIYGREGHCATCHQPDGLGLELSGFPPLSKTTWVNEDEGRLIRLTLHGLYGPLEVNGKNYPGLVPMTPFGGMLNDEELAAVLTYVRNSFGNQSAPLTASQVAKERAATKDRKGFYTPQELLNPGSAPAAPSRPFVKMWAMDDFKGAFDAPLKGRSFENGKAMFEAASCVKCHNLQGQGAGVGADLTKAADEYKGMELLRQVVDPSARIKDEFRVVGVILKDERRFKGMIVRREGDSIQLAENLQEPGKTIEVKKADIVRMIPSDLSPMPTGLLVTLSKEDILDLVAYLAAKGDAKHAVFGK